MGIKSIYGELGPGQRVSLSKLAADSLKTQGRPLRLAIDVAIWQFQAQAARGGMNPAIRTLFYRLVRLLAIPIQPVFVFDGPNKPTTKRNKRSGRGDGVANSQAKRLIRLFGLPILDAPGEAEAECALLQRHGIVDAVLSEDVDTIMFGCTRTLRNWSTEGKSSSAPTHVTLYDAAGVESCGLDRQGMVLVALMSGGDYLPDGVPGCGIKVACEAAKAGFGASLCKLKASDVDGIDAWRENLRHELDTNESGFFRTKHKTLHIPDNFPDMRTLRYYTHPVVSPPSILEQIREKASGAQSVDLESLREFTRETFDWDYRQGAVKFIRVLSQAMLVQKMMQSQDFIQGISKRRIHFSTDASPELRLSFIPQDVVPIDISGEVDEDVQFGRDGLALNSDDEFSASQTTETTPQAFDIAAPELVWVLEETTKNFAPESMRKWEDAQTAKALKKASKKSPKKSPKKKGKQVKDAGMPNGAIEGFFRVTKKSSASTAQAVAADAQPSQAKPTLSSTAKAKPAVGKASPPLLRLPKTPPPVPPSKQTGALAQGSTHEDAARLHLPPRPCQKNSLPEAIVISSSPLGPPSPAATAAKRAQAAPAISEAHAGPVHWQLASDSSPLAEAMSSSSSSRAGPSTTKIAAGKVASMVRPDRYTQTSLDTMFTVKRTAVPGTGDVYVSGSQRRVWERNLSLPVGGYGDDDDDDLFGPNSPRVPPSSDFLRSMSPLPTTKTTTKTTLSNKRRSGEDSRATGYGNDEASSSSSLSSTSGRKKLLSQCGRGFLRENELSADERDEMATTAEVIGLDQGIKGKEGVSATRWSDVSYIDLTGD